MALPWTLAIHGMRVATRWAGLTSLRRVNLRTYSRGILFGFVLEGTPRRSQRNFV